MTAYLFREWLDGRRRTMPKGSLTVHQVDSHDSFWWLPWGYKFRRQQFGPEGYRAWLFMLAMIDGGLMQYPTAEEGNERFVQRVLTLRGGPGGTNEGRCDYLRSKGFRRCGLCRELGITNGVGRSFDQHGASQQGRAAACPGPFCLGGGCSLPRAGCL